eukprot:s548_g44.t1
MHSNILLDQILIETVLHQKLSVGTPDAQGSYNQLVQLPTPGNSGEQLGFAQRPPLCSACKFIDMGVNTTSQLSHAQQLQLTSSVQAALWSSSRAPARSLKGSLAPLRSSAGMM